MRVVGGEAVFLLALGVVVDNEFDRIEHGNAALGDVVQVFTHAVFEHAVFNPRIGFGHADTLGEQAKALGGVAATARAHQRGQARIVPAFDMFFIDELNQLAFGEYDVGEIQPCEFDLLRQGFGKQAAFGKAQQQPVVKRPLVFKLQRANRVRDAFQRILDRVRVGIHRVYAPLAAGAVMLGFADAVDRRVAQIDVGRGHVYFRAQHHAAVGVFAVAHFGKALQRFCGGAVAPRAGRARLGERAAIFAHVVGGLFIDVGVARGNQVLRRLVHKVKIIAGEKNVLAPVKAQPLHRLNDRIDVFLFLFFRIGVVKAHVARAVIGLREAEIKANRLGVADVQITIRLRRKPRADFRRIGRRIGVRVSRAGLAAPATRGKLAACHIAVDDVADEVADGDIWSVALGLQAS